MFVCMAVLAFANPALAQPAGAAPEPVSPGTTSSWPAGLNPTEIVDNAIKPDRLSASLEILVLMTVLSLAPAILVMTTCFTRIVVVLALLRQAMATQQLPPAQVITGLALFMTFCVMAPTWKQIHADAISPYINPASEEQRIDRGEFWLRSKTHLR